LASASVAGTSTVRHTLVVEESREPMLLSSSMRLQTTFFTVFGFSAGAALA
jgi:hypothetical protein